MNSIDDNRVESTNRSSVDWPSGLPKRREIANGNATRSYEWDGFGLLRQRSHSDSNGRLRRLERWDSDGHICEVLDGTTPIVLNASDGDDEMLSRFAGNGSTIGVYLGGNQKISPAGLKSLRDYPSLKWVYLANSALLKQFSRKRLEEELRGVLLIE